MHWWVSSPSRNKPNYLIWAPSSEFVSSSIPSWQISTAHAQPFRGARDLAFCLKVPLDSLLIWASSEGSGETARMRRLAWTFAPRIGDKYQIRLTRSICLLTKQNPGRGLWSRKNCNLLLTVPVRCFCCGLFLSMFARFLLVYDCLLIYLSRDMTKTNEMACAPSDD